MSTPLLRHFLGSFLLLALLVLGTRPAQATHLLGGEMSYRYLDANGPVGSQFRYEITLTLYSNGLYFSDPSSIAAPPTAAQILIYNQTTGTRFLTTTLPRVSPSGSNANLPPPINPSRTQGCLVQGPSQPFYLCKYVQVVNLPGSFDGYYAVYSVAARNNTLTNINNPNGGPTGGNLPLTLYVSIAPPLIPNRSPVFSDTAVAIVCQNDTTVTLNNASDPDGDRLVYSFGTPFANLVNPNLFPPLPNPVPYFPGFSGTAPLGTGPGNFALINASTGTAKYGGLNSGLYGIAVDVSEYRTINGREVLIGTTRRDLQLVVSSCPATPPPVLPPLLTTPRNYTIEEGESLSIPIRATQASNNPLVFTANSVLLDGSGPFNASLNGNQGTVQPGNLTGTATATGNGVVTGTFVFNSVCGNARDTPYDVGVTVKDNACGGKLASDVFRITVKRAAGPNAINGPALVCDPATPRTYTAAGPVPTSYSWKAVGGTITGGQGTNAVQVTWASANITGRLVLKGVSARGCNTDSVVKTVDIRPLAALAVTPSAPTICAGSSSTLSVSGPAGLTYSWSGGGQSSTSTTLTVTPAVTTTYTVMGTDGTCTTSASVTVTVAQPPVANAGPDRSICPGVASASLGTPAVPGYIYSWSPATGLSSSTIAQPTVTLPNGTGANIVTAYTLTVTTAANCAPTVSTVRVTVTPEAIANAGPDAAVCDRKKLTLGTPAVPGYTYSWSPATGLSNASAAQPVLTAVNTTASPLTVAYTLTATTGNGCVATDAVTVTINPRPAAEAIVGPVSVCPTVTGVAYSVPNPTATAYTWLINGGSIAGGQGSPMVTVNWGAATAGAFLKVFRLNAQGCSSDTTVLPVVVNPVLQTARPTGPGDVLAVPPLPNSVCQADGPYTYRTGVFTAGSSYSWVITGGTQVSTFQNTVTVNWAPVTVPTIREIVVTETSNPTGGICRGVSAVLRVLVNPSPLTNLTITGPARACSSNGPVTFSLPGGFAGSTYAFQLSGTTLAGTGNSRTLATLPAPGTYTLTVQETTSAGCTGPVYSTPFVVAPNPVAPTISGSAFVCNTGTAQPYAISNPTPGASFQWTVTGGTVTAGGTSSQVTVQFNATGPYAVSAVEISATPNSCPSPAATRTVVLDNPSLALTNASVDAASNNRVILTLRAPNSTNTPNPVRILRRVAGSGAFAAVGTAPASATSFTDNNAVDASANTYEYQLDLTNGCGTLVPSTVAQTIRLQATAVPGPGGRNQGSSSLTWNAFVGFPVAGYQIYRRLDAGTPELLSTVSAGTLQFSVPNGSAGSATGAGFTQNFRVVAISNASGGGASLFSNSNEAGVNFANALKTYNIITPNRDGQNDVLVIDNVQLYPGNTFTVFNRWGREVYSTTNYQNNWGGDANTPAGTYFYLLKLPNGTSVKNWFEVVK